MSQPHEKESVMDAAFRLLTRFAVFLTIGPLVGVLTIIGFFALLEGGPKPVTGLINMLFLVPLGYMFGLAPAAVACVADWIARNMHSLSRMGVTVAAGYAATVLSLLPFTDFSKNNIANDLAYGLVGVVPAIVCSWLTEKLDSDNGQTGRNK